jgi:hypothetical protein
VEDLRRWQADLHAAQVSAEKAKGDGLWQKRLADHARRKQIVAEMSANVAQ